jgi:hypothetical protein
MVVGFRGIEKLLNGVAKRPGIPPQKEKLMSTDLKSLVQEFIQVIEEALDKRDGLFDAPAKAELKTKIEDLKREIDEASADELQRRKFEVLNIAATLLSAATNVAALFK